ncbi:DUF6695 family protein [Arcticibacterium luteifluviistationis]|uniref:DUF6695 domain-containing protein n=1 Tax=Arcticibacterium luteifluviistationis TaxID=1784714 RepID=A0A2Z4GBN4_9BACT|nr:DUF6695 family protein [Arcticibacterium luteifluviistationis]AWV98465.1 hypothetical protein DJ013_09890 [Arcticibacterium luteifluviistationis]
MSKKTAYFRGTLPPPEKPVNLPEKMQWLAGEGAGSWFHIEFMSENLAQINRYNPKGEFECAGLFISKDSININELYEITHLSHCMEVRFKTQDKIVLFKNVNND